MCLKQIPQPNNKDGDSCCFKSRLLRGVDQPHRERECWLFNKLRLTPVGFMAESNTTWGRTDWTHSALLEAKIRKIT